MSLHGTKASRKRRALLEEAHKNAISTRIKEITTSAEKRILIAETNPLLYLFGTVLDPKNYLTNEENDHDLSK